MTVSFSRSSSRRAMLLATLCAPMLSGCFMVGPHYHRPHPVISAHFKEAPQPPPGWQVAQPQMAEATKGEWWKIYNDPQLDALEAQVALSNQNLKQYEAQFRKAEALIDSIRAQLFPTLSGTFSFNRNSQGSQSRSASSGTVVNYTQTTTVNTWNTGPSASWTLDVWGRIRRQVQEEVTAAQASAADVANARLSYQSELAQDYFQLRYQDSLRQLYARNVEYYKHALDIVQNQVNAGVTDPTSLLQARYQLQSTQAQETNAGLLRAQYEHAIAVLIGKAPADLTIPEGTLATALPPLPNAVPSNLLQRRPDVAAAERNMESYNSEIGYQIAAFFPDISVSASYGYSGNPLQTLIQAGTRFWSLGASSTETLFNGGARSAAVREAEADYDNSVATYRQTVLTALQNVEDNFSNLRILHQQYLQQLEAVHSADEAVRVSLNEYLAGTQTYTTVITSQQNALSYEVQALSIQEQLATSHVALIVQLGGGWDVSQLPSKDSLQTNNPLLPGFIQKTKE
ncbi:efflux transporter outer membrane subunit [Kozakia baliensis]|uniref:Secretion protein n=1 Tax=Kozakia baliensis TaxID=153496 RepID=A0A1D8UUP1_9PROT|nr:efflux transporter outer membrane subunit [Kozakia baliensis]AOX17360.1 secretion protein [Kozakia baliensis]GEL63195.1 outer membrane efflux lipoprotein [Kozakia baliensis]